MRVVLIGNSGAGKTTLAKKLQDEHLLSHLDLDTLAWQDTMPPQRKPLSESKKQIDAFLGSTNNWVIEGCYADLVEMVLPVTTELVFLNPGVEQCIANCRARPWEPHKYESKEAQDANLEMLLDWVRQYYTREDEFSYVKHRALFDGFCGEKREIGG
ncbi:MAG: AAA family ATPase [Gammaproteobacteria bacterium]|nr:AAA family ATPase [Gammaproteobacteria bacterium]MDH5694770.1 AAA family ATPase [Gammaproteobacteria bacterium]